MAAWETVFERGPSLTLAEVGAKVGVSAATLVQQFGSKRNLMLGVARIWSEWASKPLEGDGGPLELFMQAYQEVSLDRTGQHVANSLASMHSDLADPDFREILADGFKAQRRILKAALDDSIRAGEIRECDTEKLAHMMQVACQGALATWAIEPEGKLKDWMTDCLESTIASWRLDAVAV